MKYCKKCGIEKELSEFSKDKKAKDGLRYACKECQNKYGHQYRQDNLQIIRERDRRYKQDNALAVREYQCQYRQEKAVTVSQYSKQYSLQYPERMNAKNAISAAVASGKLPPVSEEPCLWVDCQKQAAHRHHWNGYEKEHRFDFVPLCVSHHKQIHILYPLISS